MGRFFVCEHACLCRGCPKRRFRVRARIIFRLSLPVVLAAVLESTDHNLTITPQLQGTILLE